MSGNPISLYFHIPFCTRKCDYCHFYVLPNQEPLHVQLLAGLELEWQSWLAELRGKRLVSVYFGGGTPALFAPERIETILQWVQKVFPEDFPEVTLEANPENVTFEQMKAFRKVGINRVSIGIQTLHDPLLKVLSRTHDAAKGISAVEATYQAGIENISIDLMYDLPGQSLSHWEESLKRALQLPITHLSLYNLTLEPHTVFFKHKDSIEKQMPDPDISKEMYLRSIELLEKGSLKQYEISAFAKPGYQSKHNSGYWTSRPFLGFGPSAFSFWKGERFRNVANLSRYYKALSGGNSPIDFRETLPPKRARREKLAIQLREKEGIDVPTFTQIHGSLDHETLITLEKLQNLGWITRENQQLALTPKGILFYDSVAEELI